METILFNVHGLCSFTALPSKQQVKERPEKFRPKWDSYPDLWDAIVVRHQMSCITGQPGAGHYVGQ